MQTRQEQTDEKLLCIPDANVLDGEKQTGKRSLFSRIRRFFLSDFILSQKSASRKVAYIAVFTAISVVINAFLSLPIPTLVPITSPNVISLNMAICFLAGSVLGGFYGFSVGFIGDILCYLLFNSRGYMYFPWVGVSKALSGLIAGLIMCNFPTKRKWGVFLKAGLVCLLTAIVCTAGIETGGYYLYYKYVRNWTFNNIVSKLLEVFGATDIKINYGWYIAYRMVVLLRILENVVNSVVFIALIPVVNSIKGLKVTIR